jgi:hypothetical protein
MLILNKKPALNDFITTCSPLYKIPQLEQQCRQRVEDIVREAKKMTQSGELYDNL